MIIGVPKEIKNNENRVGLTPGGAKELAKYSKVYVEKNAGFGSGFSDKEYEKAGAKIVSKDTAWNSDLVIKVKEPQKKEYGLIKEKSTIFTYFHLAGVDQSLTMELIKKKITAIAYETVEANGLLPLLTPMSQVAGRMSALIGAYYLAKPSQGMGILASGIPGVKPAEVTILGGGVVGYNAATIAAGIGAQVTVLDIDAKKLDHVENTIHNRIYTQISNPHTISEAVRNSDIVIGAVLVPGAAAPKLVTKKMIQTMKKGSVIIDVAIDQGGCIETARPTSHSDPVYLVNGVIHYCVTNMPGAYPRTSTFGLTGATLSYALTMAKFGIIDSIKNDPGLAKGVNVFSGHITYKSVAEKFNLSYKNLKELI